MTPTTCTNKELSTCKTLREKFFWAVLESVDQAWKVRFTSLVIFKNTLNPKTRGLSVSQQSSSLMPSTLSVHNEILRPRGRCDQLRSLRSKVTHQPHLPGTVPVLAQKVPHPRKPLSPGKHLVTLWRHGSSQDQTYVSKLQALPLTPEFSALLPTPTRKE